jgi:hypothetical protein
MLYISLFSFVSRFLSLAIYLERIGSAAEYTHNAAFFTVDFGTDWNWPTMSALLVFVYLPNTPFTSHCVCLLAV